MAEPATTKAAPRLKRPRFIVFSFEICRQYPAGSIETIQC